MFAVEPIQSCGGIVEVLGHKPRSTLHILFLYSLQERLVLMQGLQISAGDEAQVPPGESS